MIRYIKAIWRRMFPVKHIPMISVQYRDSDSTIDPNAYLPQLINCMDSNKDLFAYLLSVLGKLEDRYHSEPDPSNLSQWAIDQYRLLARINTIKDIIYLPKTAENYIMSEKNRKKTDEIIRNFNKNPDDYEAGSTFGPSFASVLKKHEKK